MPLFLQVQHVVPKLSVREKKTHNYFQDGGGLCPQPFQHFFVCVKKKKKTFWIVPLLALVDSDFVVVACLDASTERPLQIIQTD